MKKPVLLIALLFFSQLFAQTIISSDITSSTNGTVSRSPYILTDTIEDRTGVMLQNCCNSGTRSRKTKITVFR